MAFKSLLSILESVGSVPTPYPILGYNETSLPINIGRNVPLYPSDTGRTHITNGYKKNAIVYSIVSKCAKKFAQVPWYHYRIKTKERKTWQEYQRLTKEGLTEKVIAEARKMRTKAVDQIIVDSPLSKRLARPNRNQNRAQYLEQLYTYKLLTGEGNTWFTRGVDKNGVAVATGKPLEMIIIPKANLNLIKGRDPWDIAGFELNISGKQTPVPKANVNMWIFNNPVAELDAVTLAHLRGMAPLEAGLLQLQGTNEGGERLVNMNKNQGANGFAANESMDAFTPQQALAARSQFDGIINDEGMVGKWGLLGGKWAVHQLGLSVDQLKILEQMDNAAKWLCGIFDFPLGLFDGNQTYANKQEDKRNLIYDNIAPAAYSLRDEWNAELLPAYDLDQELNVIDCDILALPELSKELATQVAALKDAYWLDTDEKRVASGYDAVNTEESRVILVPKGLAPLEEIVTGSVIDTSGLD